MSPLNTEEVNTPPPHAQHFNGSNPLVCGDVPIATAQFSLLAISSYHEQSYAAPLSLYAMVGCVSSVQTWNLKEEVQSNLVSSTQAVVAQLVVASSAWWIEFTVDPVAESYPYYAISIPFVKSVN